MEMCGDVCGGAERGDLCADQPEVEGRTCGFGVARCGTARISADRSGFVWGGTGAGWCGLVWVGVIDFCGMWLGGLAKKWGVT